MVSIRIDGSSEEESKGMLSAVDDLNAFLDALVDEDILPEQLALFGFLKAQ